VRPCYPSRTAPAPPAAPFRPFWQDFRHAHHRFRGRCFSLCAPSCPPAHTHTHTTHTHAHTHTHTHTYIYNHMCVCVYVCVCVCACVHACVCTYAHLRLQKTGKWSRCQPLTIMEQLELGVRYLDLRYASVRGSLLPYHRSLLPYNRSPLPYDRSLLPYNRSLLTLTHTSGVLVVVGLFCRGIGLFWYICRSC